jgi:hypothetical protein
VRPRQHRCTGSNEVVDDCYRDYHYRDGIPRRKCSGCDALRKPRITSVTLCPGATDLQLRFPYHTPVYRIATQYP